MDWELLSFILRSKRRKEIILSLESPKTPTEIAMHIKASVSHVSRTLKEFDKKDLVKCRTPRAKIGRIYVLTNDGKEILKHLKK
jgi:predicted transcriptional regulator